MQMQMSETFTKRDGINTFAADDRTDQLGGALCTTVHHSRALSGAMFIEPREQDGDGVVATKDRCVRAHEPLTQPDRHGEHR